MGQTLAQLDGDRLRVRMQLADGRVVEAGDWEKLTAQALGAPIPVRGLSWWVRGIAHPHSRHTLERDGNKRPLVLRQDGWEIVYAYADGERPRQLRMSYPEVEIRLVIDAWTTPASP